MNGANTLSSAQGWRFHSIHSPICRTRSANRSHRIQSGESSSATHAFNSSKMPSSLRSLQPRHILNIEFLPNSRHALPNRQLGFPRRDAAYAREGREPVRSLCQHLNANFPARSLSVRPTVVDSKLHRTSHRRMEMCSSQS